MAEFDRSMIQESYQMFIGGRWVDASDGKTFDTYQTTTGQKLATIPEATKADVDAAVKAAWAAFPEWKKTPAAVRAGILTKIADALEANLDKLAMCECLDDNKPLREAMFVDLPTAIAQYRYFASVIGAEEGSFIKFDEDTVALTVSEPLGVVAQIIPWNFPLMIGSWKIAPALAAGNCIVFKPSSIDSVSTLEFVKLMEDILPAGVFNVVTGSGSKCGQYLADHPDIKKLSFTGSTAVGYGIAKAAAEKLIPATLELGGKSPNVFFEDCDMDKAIDGSQLGILMNAGQVCAANSRIFIQDTIYDQMVPKLIAAFEKINVGMPWEMTTQMVGPINEDQCSKVLDYIQVGIDEGAKVLCGGKRLTEGAFAKGCFIAPTLLEGTNDMRIAQEEIFGPVAVVIKFHDEEEVVAMCNDNKYGLAGAVWTKDINRALRVSQGIESGLIWVNCAGAVPAGLPFGGYKSSGYGREIHKQALEHYRQTKSIQISLSDAPSGLFPQD